MRALFLSNDPTLFDETSVTRARMRTYAAAIGELHIVSVAHRGARCVHEEHLHLYPTRAPRLFRTRVLAWRAHTLIRACHIDIVSAQDPFEQGLAALRAVAGTTAKLHIQVHTDFLSLWFIRSGNWRSPRVPAPFLNRYRRNIADQVLPKADGIRVVSERIKASLIARYGSRIPEPSVIPVPVDPHAPEPAALPAHPFTFALVTIGRLEPEKRIEDILAALKLVVLKYPMVGLFIIGEGRERRRLEAMTRSLKLTRQVIFLGNRPDARALLGHAQAYIQASAYEGYGRTLIEAALAKIPIITTDVGIVGEVLKGYEDVLSVPVADPTALSLGIVGIIEDNAVRQGLPRNAEVSVLAHIKAAGDIPKRIAADLAQTVARQLQTSDNSS